MKLNKKIVCFTASFPYGNRETYFENELKILSKHFDQIIIIPTYNPYSTKKRDVPKNVIVYDVQLKQGFARVKDFFINFNIPLALIKEFFSNKVFLDKIKMKNWTLSLLSYGKGLNKFNSYQFNSEDTILYSYWTGQNFFIDRKLDGFIKIVRMHGWDFYLERNKNYLPLQNIIYKKASLLLPISKDIYSRLEKSYSIKGDKLFLSYLGVTNKSEYCTIKADNILRIISCSNVYALKRIHLVYEILSNINSSIEIVWDHIGSGDLLNELKDFVNSNRKENITVNFLGQKTQEEIREVYQNNYYDFFINTSEYEGLPVSIMEAFSYGIPTIATNAGGTSEIVNENNGILIPINFDSIKIAIKIENILNSSVSNLKLNAYLTWYSNFNANDNYLELVRKMYDICKEK